MSRLRLIAVGLIVLLVAFGVVYSSYRSFLNTPIDGDKDRNIVVTEGMSANQIVDMLEQEGLIDSPRYLQLHLWSSGKGKALLPGAYRVPAGTTVAELVQMMTEGGEKTEVSLLVHAGTNLFELAAQLHEVGLVDEEIFLERVNDPQYVAELGVPARSLEGYLAPGRYVFERGAALDAIIEEMHAQFRKTWSELVAANQEQMAALRTRYRFGDHELVTLASLVAEEGMVDGERPALARVFYNRFDSDMKLQSDPTCVYPPREKGEKPTPARCHDAENPYSTYTIEGLPPGPITNPGRASLASVLRPYEGAGADQILYFVGRNDGSWRHWFSTTLKEHERAIDHFLRKQGPAPNQTRQPRY